jgi:predicted metal-dependent hydrolase
MSEQVHIDDLRIEVHRSPHRRNVDLSVGRDGGVVIAVPENLEEAKIVKIIQNKQAWIYKALKRKEATYKSHPPKEYVSGEGFFYLGRKYRLKLLKHDQIEQNGRGLKFQNGRFFLPHTLTPKGKEIFVQWYSRQAGEWIGRRVNSLKDRVAVEPESVGIRDLGLRWASCTHKGKMFFHWRVILLPPERIDYLIIHELVHIHEHNHSPAFYERLRRASPDHKQHEDWLRRYGDLYSL